MKRYLGTFACPPAAMLMQHCWVWKSPKRLRLLRLLVSLREVSPIVQVFAVLLGLVSGRVGSRAKVFWWGRGTAEGMGSDLKENKVQPLAAVKRKAEGVISHKSSSLTSDLTNGSTSHSPVRSTKRDSYPLLLEKPLCGGDLSSSPR